MLKNPDIPEAGLKTKPGEAMTSICREEVCLHSSAGGTDKESRLYTRHYFCMPDLGVREVRIEGYTFVCLDLRWLMPREGKARG